MSRETRMSFIYKQELTECAQERVVGYVQGEIVALVKQFIQVTINFYKWVHVYPSTVYETDLSLLVVLNFIKIDFIKMVVKYGIIDRQYVIHVSVSEAVLRCKVLSTHR